MPEEDYLYEIKSEPGSDGRTLWRWTVRRRDGDAILAYGVDVTSEAEAEAQAKNAIIGLTWVPARG